MVHIFREQIVQCGFLRSAKWCPKVIRQDSVHSVKTKVRSERCVFTEGVAQRRITCCVDSLPRRTQLSPRRGRRASFKTVPGADGLGQLLHECGAYASLNSDTATVKLALLCLRELRAIGQHKWQILMSCQPLVRQSTQPAKTQYS